MKLAQARKIAMALPEVYEEPHFQSTSFRIRGKIIATSPPGEEFLHVFIPDSEREPAVALNPTCVDKLFWGGKVAGVRVKLSVATSLVVVKLLQQAWMHKAPKSLLAEYLSRAK